MSQTSDLKQAISNRILSVDFFRGFTMFLLIGESTNLFTHINAIQGSSFAHFLGQQLEHHEWHGLHFWDLIQPFFMFIVGVAIPFATANRLKKGESERTILIHAIKRSLLLLFLGWALYCVDPGKIVFQFQNVLAQLSVAYLVAFLISRKSVAFQLIFSFLLLLGTDLAYRYFSVAGFNHPWIPFENLGAWINNQIEGVEKASIWASLNAIPTTAHTIWGVLMGLLLMSSKSSNRKLLIMFIGGIIALLAGFLLDWMNVTPIIKKIATASFVLASGGWAILALYFSYWLIDVQKRFSKGAEFFIVVGTNCIFIYLFFHIGGADLIGRVFIPFAKLFFSWAGELTVKIVTSCATWMSLWYICYFLYKKKIFIKI